jgi:NHLM bacteriocin system secretion protein
MLGPRQDLFTKASLEKLSSPEQLDVLMEVTKPMGWVGLGTTGFLLFMGVLWGIFGSIPIRVDGKGILIIGGSLIDVEAGSTGRIGEVMVKPGQVLAVDDPVASVGQGKLDEEIKNAKAALEDSQRKYRADSRNESETLRLALAALDQQKKNLTEQLKAMPGTIQSYKQQLETKTTAFRQGLTTQSAVLQAQTQLDAALNSQKTLQNQLESIPAERAKAEQASKAALSTRENDVRDAERKIKTLEGQLAANSIIRSTHAGRVVEMTVTRGALVAPNTRVVSLEPLDAKLTGVLYIPSGEGKKAAPGMEVRVSPSTVKAEEYGFMKGVVRSVSTYPATPEGLMLTLRNEVLVKELTGGSAPLEVVVDLIETDNESGYQWSSPKGPPVGIFGGTMSTGSIIIDRRRPISYVIPMVKEKLGM